MDLDLSLGPPRPGRRQPALDLGFDLALSSPVAPPPSSASSSSSSSTSEELRAPISDATVAMAERPPFPYSPSCSSFADPTVPSPPPIPAGGGDLVREYSPYSPSYQSLGPPYAPIAPQPAAATRRHGLLFPGSYIRIYPTDQGSLDRGFPLHLPYDPASPMAPDSAPALVGGGGAVGTLPHALYSPPPAYAPLSMIPEEQEEAAYAQRPLPPGPRDPFTRGGDGSSSRPGLLDTEVRLRRLLAWRRRPGESGFFPAGSPYGDEQAGSSPATGDLDPSEASAEVSEKSKAGDEGLADEGLEEDEEEEGASAVNFECNICLELAKEPVVTPCGHLFCWPCLYQWLHLHCNYNECPVCKGEVMESDITPIYGRGSSQTRLEEEENGDLGLKIPPRPRGRRSESWRQRIQRPISRRFGLEVASSWRRLFGEEVHFGSMIDVHGDPIPSLQQIIGVESTSIGRRSSGVGDSMENGYFSVGHPLPWRHAPSIPQNGSNTSSVSQGGGFGEIWAQVSSNSIDSSGSLAAVGPSRIWARTGGSANITGVPAPLLDTRNPGGSVLRPPVASSRAVGQASASSTMAVIQGDVSITDAAAEPNGAGSSRHLRMRGRSSGSLFAEGCPVHACKGRRLN